VFPDLNSRHSDLNSRHSDLNSRHFILNLRHFDVEHWQAVGWGQQVKGQTGVSLPRLLTRQRAVLAFGKSWFDLTELPDLNAIQITFGPV
jgi:hypothetical protein